MEWLRLPRNIDIFINYIIGRFKIFWSDYGGNKRQTISSSLGAEEAEVLYKEWKSGVDITKIEDIEIPSEHLLGEFSSDLCDLFQRYHALRSIDWKKPEEKKLTQKYPGIEGVVSNYLKSKGIEEA